MALSIQQAKLKIQEKFNYLTLIKYCGYRKKCIFYDNQYGFFNGIFVKVLYESKRHRNRSLFNLKNPTIKIPYNKRKKGSFIQSLSIVNIKIKKEYSYLTVLKYNGFKKEALFKDDEFGEFSYNYEAVYRGQTHHPDRIKYNRKNAYIQCKITNLEKYGCENVFQNENIKNKIKKTCLEKYGSESAIQSECVKNIIIKNNNKKYGVDYPSQHKDIKNKVKKSFINNKIWNSIDGYTLPEYYRLNDIPISYSYFKKIYYRNKDNFSIDLIVKRIKIAEEWLRTIEEKLGYKLVREFRIKQNKYIVDGYDPLTNTIYEFHGDYWH